MPKGIIILKVCQLVCKPNDSNNSEKEVIKKLKYLKYNKIPTPDHTPKAVRIDAFLVSPLFCIAKPK